LDSQISARPLARKILEANPSGEDVATYDIPRAWHYGLNFYLNRDLPEWTTDSKASEWVAGNIATDPQFQLRYDVQLDETARANRFQVCLYRKK
jgi:hypothetical protein